MILRVLNMYICSIHSYFLTHLLKLNTITVPKSTDLECGVTQGSALGRRKMRKSTNNSTNSI